MPEHVTVEEVEQLFVESWKLGLKAVAIYRDNCKVAQPMSADKKKTAVVPEGEPQTLPWSAKKRLPRSRPAITRPSGSATPRATSRRGPTPTTGSARSS